MYHTPRVFIYTIIIHQGYLRRLSNSSAIFSLQQQFFATTVSCNFNTHRDVLVFFIWSLPKFAAYHWLNVSCVPLYIPLSYTLIFGYDSVVFFSLEKYKVGKCYLGRGRNSNIIMSNNWCCLFIRTN
jgi:hypothetical protein